MSDQRTQTQVLYEVLGEEALRASSEIARLREQIPPLVDGAVRDLKHATELHTEKLNASMTIFTKKAEMFELEGANCYVRMITAHDKVLAELRMESARLLEESRNDLLRLASTKASDAAVSALHNTLTPLTKEMLSATTDAAHRLNLAAVAYTKAVSSAGWRQSLRTVSLVVVAVTVVLLANRLIDDAWPWKLTEAEKLNLGRGKTIADHWNDLDKTTQNKINELIRSYSTSP